MARDGDKKKKKLKIKKARASAGMELLKWKQGLQMENPQGNPYSSQVLQQLSKGWQ